MTKPYDQMCPVARTLDLIGERWTLLIVRELFFGRRRFSEFQEQLPAIPARVLSDRLKNLARYGFVERAVYSQHPLRAEYRLTEKGESLRPVLGAIAAWGLEHCYTAAERRAVAAHVAGSAGEGVRALFEAAQRAP